MPSDNQRVVWVLESDVYPRTHAPLRDAITRLGHRLVEWSDEWWDGLPIPDLSGATVVFHGSLENASRINRELPWSPGAFCDTAAFFCSAWYPQAREWVLNNRWEVMPANELVANQVEVLKDPERSESLFVRPDSPLKPFSGRVVERSTLNLAALDHGYYFDDEALPVLVAPVRDVEREWRYVVVGKQVVAGSAYAADGRTALPDEPSGEPWRFATRVADALVPPEEVYVLDVCETGGQLRLLELNPFSGADLYSCEAERVVQTVSEQAVASRRTTE